MKVLTLSIKQKFFDQIVNGTKKKEFRFLSPSTFSKHAKYVDENGKEYSDGSEIPDDAQSIDIVPLGYDALKLCTGAYKGKRPYIVVKINKTEIELFSDKNGELITYEHNGQEYVECQAIYHLGGIIETFGGNL